MAQKSQKTILQTLHGEDFRHIPTVDPPVEGAAVEEHIADVLRVPHTVCKRSGSTSESTIEIIGVLEHAREDSRTFNVPIPQILIKRVGIAKAPFKRRV